MMMKSHSGHCGQETQAERNRQVAPRETACDVRGPDFGFLTSRSLPLQDDCCSFATIVARHAVLSLLGVRGLSFLKIDDRNSVGGPVSSPMGMLTETSTGGM